MQLLCEGDDVDVDVESVLLINFLRHLDFSGLTFWASRAQMLLKFFHLSTFSSFSVATSPLNLNLVSLGKSLHDSLSWRYDAHSFRCHLIGSNLKLTII
jgi:hypothetical protein